MRERPTPSVIHQASVVVVVGTVDTKKPTPRIICKTSVAVVVVVEVEVEVMV